MTEFQAWFFLVLAFVSAGFVFSGIVYGRRTARQQTTLAFINDYNSDPRVSAGHAILRALGNGENGASILEKGDNRVNFLFLMNMFEILAVGLRNGIYDRKMTAEIFGRDICEIYAKSEPLIAHIRRTESDGEAFSEFEILAQNIRAQRRG